MKKISLGSWAFSFGPYPDHPISFEQTAKRLPEAGYDGIEIRGLPPHITPDKYASVESRRELVWLQAERHLGISGYAADLTSTNPLLDGNRLAYLDLFSRNADLCADIGCPGIRVDTVGPPGSERPGDFERVASLWREASGIAQQRGVRMAWEFEPGFAFNKPSEVVRLHDAVSHSFTSTISDARASRAAFSIRLSEFGFLSIPSATASVETH